MSNSSKEIEACKYQQMMQGKYMYLKIRKLFIQTVVKLCFLTNLSLELQLLQPENNLLKLEINRSSRCLLEARKGRKGNKRSLKCE